MVLLRRKSDTFTTFKQFKVLAENQLGRKIRALHDDKGGEYMSKEFNTFCDESGILRTREIDTNCVMLRHAYEIVFKLMTASGLALEHDKTELFHFTRARTGFDRPLDLGYAPYTGDNLLKPQEILEVLGVLVRSEADVRRAHPLLCH